MGAIESIMRKAVKKVKDRRSKRWLSDILGYQPMKVYPDFLIKGIEHINNLKKMDDFSLNYANGEWVCNLEGLAFSINSTEELLILEEVFINGIYNVEVKHPYTFIDIGMNVGITSLFFASKPLCKRIVAFEPFQPTLYFARKNLEKNKLAEKIQVNEVGLGYPPRTLNINYSEASKGSVGINGVAPYIEKADTRVELLPIIDVFETLKDITDKKIILKIDCEGSEYEILERLNETGLLPRFDVIMIEWHIKGPAPLQKILSDNDFEILSMGKHNLNIGMLYAFKK